MRVTNKMLSNNFLRDMRTNLNNLSTLQNQRASGKLISKPSDDPGKASKIMQMYSEIDANKQYNSNIKNTTNWLDMTDTALGQVGGIIGEIENQLQSTGSGYGKDEKQAIKDVINQKIGELSQMLNTSFDGKYIFGGTDGTTKPVDTKTVGKNTELVCNTKVVAKLIGEEMTYGAKTVGAGETFNISLNGVSMPITTTDAITSGTTTMETAAGILQTSINNAITEGKDKVTVTATDDGRFNITSPSGSITFSDEKDATTAKELGLSQESDKLLVEISQGVTMDYNITASQAINYGTGDNENLIKLLGDITTHLDSTNPEEIKKLINEDLEGIKKAGTNILKLRSEVGAKQNRMESAGARNVEQNFNMAEILAATEDIDVVEKTMEYATMQSVYMASLQTSAQVLQPTLLDYLR